MKIYLAARYSRAGELRGYSAQLAELGHQVTSRWIDGSHEAARDLPPEDIEHERSRWAREDMADLKAADLVISFTEEPKKTTSRGGRHVEHGIALALGKRVMAVGWQENVFHCLPEVEFFRHWQDAVEALA